MTDISPTIIPSGSDNVAVGRCGDYCYVLDADGIEKRHMRCQYYRYESGNQKCWREHFVK